MPLGQLWDRLVGLNSKQVCSASCSQMPLAALQGSFLAELTQRESCFSPSLGARLLGTAARAAHCSIPGRHPLEASILCDVVACLSEAERQKQRTVLSPDSSLSLKHQVSSEWETKFCDPASGLASLPSLSKNSCQPKTVS